MDIDGWIDLSDRAKFLLRGPDAERYLNGQTTNDVTRATAGAALYSLITTAKGKLEADVFISRHGAGEAAGFLIDGPAELRKELGLRLEKYLIADDAELEDVTGVLRIIHSPGGEPPEADDVPARRANRYGVEGWELVWNAGERDVEIPGDERSAADLEPLRIAHGIPRWGAELTPDILPQEARLEGRAIDFHKGCYIGQEVISRIKSVGRVNRLLCAFVALEDGEAEAEIEAGMELIREGTAVGRLTSVARNRDLGRITALGYVKRDVAEAGTVLSVQSSEKNKLLSRLEIHETPLC